ncbi:hypothetical protein RQ831_03895 [Roseomonas gilardii]|uniref:Uncharacterized protein n=1 Tax=Roseomonas gilardii TaxID=257708 RepID=A0ABU3MC73_9PROT|nr:hypothetical protein [Roseomonas gilardii]MDT8330183.1 hypothetical protein [Roseomonas gilardii]
MSMEYGVTPDRTRAVVRVDARLDAARLEELIAGLRDCRASIVPKRFPIMFPGSRISIGNGVHVQEDAAGLLVAVSHPGLGWVGARISIIDLWALMPRACSGQQKRSQMGRLLHR